MRSHNASPLHARGQRSEAFSFKREIVRTFLSFPNLRAATMTERLRVTSRRVYMRNAALLLAWRVHLETKLHNGTAGKAGACERGRRIKRESFTELG